MISIRASITHLRNILQINGEFCFHDHSQRVGSDLYLVWIPSFVCCDERIKRRKGDAYWEIFSVNWVAFGCHKFYSCVIFLDNLWRFLLDRLWCYRLFINFGIEFIPLIWHTWNNYFNMCDLQLFIA